MARVVRAEFSITEVPHFTRLVAFLNEIDRLADDRCDLELQDLVEDCREDLVALTIRHPE